MDNIDMDKKIVGINLKVSAREKDQIVKASGKEHLTLTAFIRRSSLKEAEKIIGDDNGAAIN